MRVPGVPFDPGTRPQGSLNPTAIVLHRTYGTLNGDGYKGAYSIGKYGRSGVGIGFHFLVGKNEGQWVQFYDTTTKAAHAAGANSWAVGIEFDGVNEGPLTDWQVRAGAVIIAAVCDAHNMPRTYVSGGPRRRVAGCLAHAVVPGSDHTDMVTDQDWARIVAAMGNGTAPVPPADPNIDWAAVRRFAAAVLLPQVQALPTLRRGMKGGRVQTLQKAINLVANARLVEDGDFGPGTETAVKNFQRFFGLGADGIAGPKTLGMLAVCLAKVKGGQ